MCFQNWQTVNKHQANEHLPSSFSVAEGTQLFFLPCHPSMDRIPSLPPALPGVSHSATVPFSPQQFLSLELPLYPCTTCFVCFSTWLRASTSFLSCRYILAAQPSCLWAAAGASQNRVLNIPTFSSRKSSGSPSIQSLISIQYYQFGQY